MRDGLFTMNSFVRATILQTSSPEHLDVKRDVLIEVSEGIIRRIDPASSRHDLLSDKSVRVTALSEGMYLLPGFIDCHIHAPQWPQLGIGLDLPLERWLFDYTFPLESKFENIDYANAVWSEMVPALLGEGTTTAVYFSSIHNEATLALAKTCLRYGQRSFIGRVAMDSPEGTPEYYRDVSASEGVSLSRESIGQIQSLDAGRGLISPIITPRFTPACTDALLSGLGELAMETGALIQTHCSESDWQHQYAFERFRVSDTQALKQFNLLQKNTVLAHGNHTSVNDWEIMCAIGAGVAHCPLSNAYFAGGVFPARRAITHGLTVGLGTDISGGSDSSVLAQCHNALTASQYLDSGVDVRKNSQDRGVPNSRLDVIAAFWMATLGGANLLGLPVGQLEVGKPFDAIAVRDLGAGFEPARNDALNHELQTIERILRRSRNAQITDVWVAGNRVSGIKESN